MMVLRRMRTILKSRSKKKVNARKCAGGKASDAGEKDSNALKDTATG